MFCEETTNGEQRFLSHKICKLKCSDGQERQSWSLQKNVAYLSNEENKEHTDGVVSTTDNITMMSYVAARENATVGEIMDID